MRSPAAPAASTTTTFGSVVSASGGRAFEDDAGIEGDLLAGQAPGEVAGQIPRLVVGGRADQRQVGGAGERHAQLADRRGAEVRLPGPRRRGDDDDVMIGAVDVDRRLALQQVGDGPVDDGVGGLLDGAVVQLGRSGSRRGPRVLDVRRGLHRVDVGERVVGGSGRREEPVGRVHRERRHLVRGRASGEDLGRRPSCSSSP